MASRKRKRIRRFRRTPEDIKRLLRASARLGKHYEVDLYIRRFKTVRHRRKMFFEKIPVERFEAGRFYKIYVRHRKTRLRRLLGLGKFFDLPLRKKEIEKFGRLFGGRTFKPLPEARKAKGNWVPVSKIVNEFSRELSDAGMELKKEVRGMVLPTKRYFHKDWLIFSDRILKGTDKFRQFIINAVVRFDYDTNQWVQKQNAFVSFHRPIMIKNIREKWLERFRDAMEAEVLEQHPKALVAEVPTVGGASLINGFVPIG